jgi:hypothetical protein
MALTVAEIRALQPRAAPYKVADENGLYLLITPSGTKLWKLKFRFRGAEKKLSFGQFPDISLKAARLKSEDARRQLANGIDPADAKRKAVVEAHHPYLSYTTLVSSMSPTGGGLARLFIWVLRAAL